MKLAVLDDEIQVVEDILKKLKKYEIQDSMPNVYEGFTDYETFISHFMNDKYDLVYLDIELGATNGIDIAREIRSIYKDCIIIFITNYKQYYHDGYEVNAFQFIEKPIDDEFFYKELKRAINHYRNMNHYIYFHTSIGNKYINTKDILYLQTAYTEFEIHTIDHVYKGKTKSLNQPKKELLQSHFYKLNRSTVINLLHVDRFGIDWITLDNGTTLSISKRNRKEFKKVYENYIDEGN